MQQRPLGRSGISIGPIMLGGNVFGWTADEKTSHAVLDAFVEAGFNAIDTADVYSAWAPGHTGGESETTIGSWLAGRGKRDDVVIATKLGMWPKFPKLTKANIVAACEDSLKRLRTGHIDLYQAHKDDAETPLDETMEAFAALKQAGKVRAIGASNYGAARLAAANRAAKDGVRFETLQPEYNGWRAPASRRSCRPYRRPAPASSARATTGRRRSPPSNPCRWAWPHTR